MTYEPKVQRCPKLEPFKEKLAEFLAEDSSKPAKHRRTAVVLFEQLQREGFDGYDSVRRYVQRWRIQGKDGEVKRSFRCGSPLARRFSLTGATGRSNRAG